MLFLKTCADFASKFILLVFYKHGNNKRCVELLTLRYTADTDFNMINTKSSKESFLNAASSHFSKKKYELVFVSNGLAIYYRLLKIALNSSDLSNLTKVRSTLWSLFSSKCSLTALKMLFSFRGISQAKLNDFIWSSHSVVCFWALEAQSSNISVFF